jgi:hypothetical protein
MRIPLNTGASGVRAGKSTTAREPLEVPTFRKAPRGWRQRRGHISLVGGAPTTSQGRCKTFRVLISNSHAGAPGVSVGRFATTREPLVPALKKASHPRRPLTLPGGGGGSSNPHSQQPPRGGSGLTMCVVLMQTTNAGALGVGVGTGLPPHAAAGGGCKH